MSDRLTLGVEEEFFVVTADGHLSRRAGDVVDAAADDHDGELQRELTQAQAELATGICRTNEDVLDDLRDLRTELASAAERLGLRLVPSGCALLPEDNPPDITPNARYRRMAEHFGAVANRVSTCGCHVHVAIADKESGVRVINHVRPWLPVLLATTANSPVELGADTGYRSWRYQRWTQWPSAGPPPLFASLDHYEHIIDRWLRSGAVMDRAMVYWDVRLSDKQPTLEFRISDVCATPEDATLLAVLVRALTHMALNTEEPAPDLSNEVLRGNLWRASHDGLTGHCPHPDTGDLVPAYQALDDLVTRVTPALRENDDLDYARAAVARLGTSGGGADRQCAAFGRRQRPEDIVDALAVPGRSAQPQQVS
jgi:carboxylate-amine ligase